MRSFATLIGVATVAVAATLAAILAATTAVAVHASTTNDWPSYGLDRSETRFSQLRAIDAGNAKSLGLVWSYDLRSTRGVEATPLVVDGVMYVTAPWSVVHALDAATGKPLWRYDPAVVHADGYKACCDVVNRGAAYADGKVFFGTLDGRLIALEARSGRKLWETDTVTDHSRSYTITGAPRVYEGKVLIGNAGGEYGVRGYVGAYDAESGKQLWRWFTVPGNPALPYENAAMAAAAATWDPSGKYWETGGGGTVWNAMAYDPELHLIYIGTDNGAPWSYRKRSPGGGDNLYTCSIVALDARTGKYVWHYQENPADNWDFSSVQDLILADLTIEGKVRKTILHAPKNGFFFVIDRTTGQFISAKNFMDVNWASGYDTRGRPIERPRVRDGDEPFEIIPSPSGGHNWQSMSWNPTLGLAYIPVQNVPSTLSEDKGWKGVGSNLPGELMGGIGWNTAEFANTVPPTSQPFGRLVAWDPIKQQQRWSVEYVAPWNGGTLTTAGNLVFQGTSDGRFVAYDARTGRALWESPTGTGVVAAPITYEVRGRQYVSIAVGWGGIYGQSTRSTDRNTPGTVYTFALGGRARLPAFVDYQLGNLVGGIDYARDKMAAGTALYVSYCATCHGIPGVNKGGDIPNLGYVPSAVIADLDNYVLGGILVDRGMPNFGGKLTVEDVDKIKAFILGTADAVRPKPLP